MRKKAYKDTAFNAIDYLSTLVIFLITTKLLITQLGTDGYGFYMFFTSLIGTFGLVDIGMGMAVSKYLSEFIHQNKFIEGNQVITQAFIFYSAIGVVLVSAINYFSAELLSLFNFSAKFSQLGVEILFITTLVFMMNLFISIGTNVLVALEKWQEISLLNIILKILNAIVLVRVLLLDIGFSQKVEYVFYSILIFSVLKFLLYSGLAYWRYPEFEWQKPTTEIRGKISIFLKWTSMQYGLSMMVGHVDKIIISRFFGLETLGVYSFVVNAFIYLFGFLTSAFKIFFPKLSKVHADKDIQKLKFYFKRLMLGSLAVSVFIGSVSLACWIPFVSLYIDTDFANKSFLYFLIFAIYLVIRSPEIIFSYFFNATAKPVVLVKNVAIGSVVTVISYFIFVPIFGTYGLIVAQIAGSLAIYCYVYYQIKKNGFHDFATA